MSSTTIGYRETHSLVQVVLTVTAVSALLVGAAVYLLDRDWASTMLLDSFASYAVRGQFDNADLFATGFGCLTALVATTAGVPDSDGVVDDYRYTTWAALQA